MALTAAQEAYWRASRTSRPPADPRAPLRVTAGYAGSPEITDRLVDLYLDGTKTAGSSLLEEFLAAGDPVPQVGDHWIVLGGDGEPRCLLRTVWVEQHRFADVPPEIALAEGEGDLSIAFWKRAHAEHYAAHLEAWGVGDLDAATVVTEFFEVAYR